MEIERVNGCTAFSLNVDGKEEIDMTDEERFAVIDKISEWLKKHPEKFNYYLQAVTEYLGDYEVVSNEPCECCGDIVDRMYLEI